MGASLLVLANKRDLPNCMSLEEINNVRRVLFICNNRHCRYLPFRRIHQKYFPAALLQEKMYGKVYPGWSTISVISGTISIDVDRSVIWKIFCSDELYEYIKNCASLSFPPHFLSIATC